MNARRLLLLVLIALVPLPAPAQVDDLLTPLTPANEKARKTHRKKQRAREDRPKWEDAGGSTALPAAKAKGRLLVRGFDLPPRSVVLVDGQEVKPGLVVELEPGQHTVVVRRLGFREYSAQTAVSADRTVEIAPRLEPVSGVVRVVADVPGSQVLVDGRRIGEAPVQEFTLTPGDHEVILRREGFEDYLSRLSVSAGRDYTVSGTLKPKAVEAVTDRTRLVPRGSVDHGIAVAPSTDSELETPSPWYGRWYVWAGVGAVVAAGAASAFMVTQNGAARPLDPNRDVCGGACTGTLNAPSSY